MKEQDLTEFYDYLGVDPSVDYWYPCWDTMTWHVSKGLPNGGSYDKPIRYKDLNARGRKEHPELNPNWGKNEIG